MVGAELRVEIEDPTYAWLQMLSGAKATCVPDVPFPEVVDIIEGNFSSLLPLVWSLETRALFNRSVSYARLLSIFRGARDELPSVLDVSGGIGFPFLRLLQDGYDVVYNDASKSMCEYVKARIAPSDFGRVRCGDWLRLEEDRTFDAVICLGNSMPYVVGGWGEERDEKRGHTSLVRSFEKFRTLVDEGGALIFDLAGHDDQIAQVGASQVSGVEASILRRIRCASGVRHWELAAVSPVGEHLLPTLTGESLIVDPLALEEMVLGAGFRSLSEMSEGLSRRMDKEGDHYRSYVAR